LAGKISRQSCQKLQIGRFVGKYPFSASKLEDKMVATDIYAGHRGAQKGTMGVDEDAGCHRPGVSVAPTQKCQRY